MYFLKDSKLLLADDDHSTLQTVLSHVESLDIEIIYANNGQKAIELAIDEQPDLILMDWQMPVMNGIEAIDILLSEEMTKEIPVIVISGVMVESQNLEQALVQGAVDFIRKPLDRYELRARLNSSLRIRKQYQIIKDLIDAEKELLKERLQTKERELTSKSFYDFQRDKLLKNLLEQVSRLDRITKHVHATNIRPIQKQLISQLNMKRNWQQFNQHFEQVHPGFFENLKSKYKTLTLNDCKLCAYLKMGLSNGEIASVMHIARGSVDRALNRLKKKLKLKERECLRRYITNLI